MIMVSQRFSFQLVGFLCLAFNSDPVLLVERGGSGLLLLVALSSPNSFIFVCANVCKHSTYVDNIYVFNICTALCQLYFHDPTKYFAFATKCAMMCT